MSFSLTSYKKFFAAAVTAVAAIAIPAQATDCNTICQTAAQQAGNNAQQQLVNSVQNDCLAQAHAQNVPWYGANAFMTQCMNSHAAEFKAAYDQAYQQTYNQCMGSCH